MNENIVMKLKRSTAYTGNQLHLCLLCGLNSDCEDDDELEDAVEDEELDDEDELKHEKWSA